MAYNYSDNSYNKEHMARVVGRALPISTKAAIEICNKLRRKTVARAKNILKEVSELKTPIKYTRFTGGAGHKRGIGPGKYPQKAAGEILKLIESVEANAQFKGMNTSDLIIKHISAQNAGNVWRYGRHKRRKAKRTNIELVVEEGKAKKEDTTSKKVKTDSKEKAVKKELKKEEKNNKAKEEKSKGAEDKK